MAHPFTIGIETYTLVGVLPALYPLESTDMCLVCGELIGPTVVMLRPCALNLQFAIAHEACVPQWRRWLN